MPAFLGGFLRDFLALFGGERFASGASALQPAFAAQGDGGGVLVRIGGGIRRAVLDLAGENVAYELGKLDRVARAGESLICHA